MDTAWWLQLHTLGVSSSMLILFWESDIVYKHAQLLFFCWMCFRNFPSSQYNFLLTIFEKTWSYALLTSMCGLKRLCVLTLECSITYLSKNFYIQNRINKLSLMEINLILLILFCAAREVQMKQGIEKTGLPALRLSLLATYSEAVDRKGNKSPI